jgi:caa(3)-type oxidase subunit IV
MADSIEAIQKSKRTYLLVFGALLVFTVLTVAVATVPFLDIGGHGFDAADATLGLMIASAKAGLVALIFMHLNHEKKAIYWIFGASFIFVICLFGLTALAEADPIFDKWFFQ